MFSAPATQPAAGQVSETATEQAGQVSTATAQFDALNRLTQLSENNTNTVFAYDNNGNLLTETVLGRVQKRYEYDTRDQLKRVFAGNSTQISAFDYDFSRRRTAKQTASSNLHYVYAGDAVIDEFDSSSALLPLQNRYELGAGEVVKGELRNEPTNYYFSDALGSTTNLSQLNGTQSFSTSVSEYDSFGKVNLQTGASANAVGYTGQRLDTETGLMALGNGERYYSPALARFTQQDSVVGMTQMPQTLNRYSYAVNNPHRYTDPTGNYLESAIDVASLGIGIYSFQDNVRQGNYLSAALDAVGIVADVIALVLPVVPGIAGLTIKGIRATAAIKAVQIVDRTINTVQASVAAGESFGRGDIKWGLINTGLALLGGKGVQSSLGGLSKATGGQGSGLEQLEKIEELTKGSAKAQRIVEDAGELGAKPKRRVNDLIAATEERIADVRNKYGFNEASNKVNFDDGNGLYRANLMDGVDTTSDAVNSNMALKRRLGREGKVAIYGNKLVNSFKNTGEVVERLGNLKNALRKIGFDDVQVGIRGSAVTGNSSKGGSFRWTDSPSDIDFFVVSHKLEKMLGEEAFKEGVGQLKRIRGISDEIYDAFNKFNGETTERMGRGSKALPITKGLFEDLNPSDYIIR